MSQSDTIAPGQEATLSTCASKRMHESTMPDQVPIALFVFRRPDHTRQVLDSLAANPEAGASPLYIFCDGGRGDWESANVKKTRALVKKYPWPGCKYVIENPKNLGLSRSIVAGVDHVLARHECLIVVEDDIVVERDFLAFMRGALARYRDEAQVACVSGYAPAMPQPAGDASAGFFSHRISTWGWGTWRRAWAMLDRDWERLREELRRNPPDCSQIGHDFARYLNSVDGDKVPYVIWDAPWQFPLYLAGMTTFWPYRSRVTNIGFDGSGENCPEQNWRSSRRPSDPATHSQPLMFPQVTKARSKQTKQLLALLVAEMKNATLLQRCRNLLAGNAHARSAYFVLRDRLRLSPRNNRERDWRLARLAKRLPRRKPGTVDLGWAVLSYTDIQALHCQFRDVYLDRCFALSTSSQARRIIDCGGNLGLSSLWFAEHFPEAKIDVFEANPELYKCLEENLRRKGILGRNVIPHRAAFSEKNGLVALSSSGLLSPRYENCGDRVSGVKSAPLSELILEDIDLLKIDVGGEELSLLNDLIVTGAIRKIQAFVCRAHIAPDRVRQFSQLTKRLYDSGFALSFGSLRDEVILLGRGPIRTPFEALNDAKATLLIYGWRLRF